MGVMRGKVLGFLLLFVWIHGMLSNANLVQGGDDIVAARKFNSYIVSKGQGFLKRGGKNEGGEEGMHKTTEEINVVGEKVGRKQRILMSEENYRAQFVAFVADYKGPRHHPPKNN
ncbi:uncharacterized protein LOC127245612 [Andrographis paniculata]|uniref:uncharacterized protein LOC127245612 n=1 Tax=Andrographis paniculata TaxID=175694 RepID=UPI0021E6ECA8|nr:uncharacterized protein LOC127245612 [Andrographis paniculata]